MLSMSSQRPRRLVRNKTLMGCLERAWAKDLLETLSVSSSTSTGTGWRPSWNKGMTLVDQVMAEKPT